jgi:hypothetical protein
MSTGVCAFAPYSGLGLRQLRANLFQAVIIRAA